MTAQKAGPFHLALAYPKGAKEHWAILSDEITDQTTFQEYALRFDGEENFLDDKSNGFNWEDSQLRNAESLQRLTLVLAIATLYVTLLGAQVVSEGKRREVDPHWFRGYSYFRIGWQWLLTALNHTWNLLKTWTLINLTDPDPVMASKIQDNHLKKKKRKRFGLNSEVFDFSFLIQK